MKGPKDTTKRMEKDLHWGTFHEVLTNRKSEDLSNFYKTFKGLSIQMTSVFSSSLLLSQEIKQDFQNFKRTLFAIQSFIPRILYSISGKGRIKTWSDTWGLKTPTNVWKLLGDTVHQNKEVKQERQDPGNRGSIKKRGKGNFQDAVEERSLDYSCSKL